MRRKHNALIGERTAETDQKTIGCVYPRTEEVSMEVKGRCLMTGLPRTFTVNSTEILDALEEVSASIVEAIHWVIEAHAARADGRYFDHGIVMTGGGSLIWGFDKLVASKDRHPDPCGGRGDLLRGIRHRQLPGKTSPACRTAR